MKKIYSLLFVLASTYITKAQVVLNENFNSPFNLTTAGWVNFNNSVPQGTVTWYQGNVTQFNAYNGNGSDYYAVDWGSQGSTSGGISNFLITPTVTLMNGAQISFATRTNTSATFPDRMQVLMSQGTGTGAIGAGTTAVGTFTTTLFDINPSLSTTGYPSTWTVYTATISGITGTVAGRFAFRYFVVDGGLNGANADYIGLDAVNYQLPCGAVAPNFTACAGTPLTINAVGGLAATTYSWSTGSTSSSIAVSPSVTTTYTLSTFANSVSCGSPQVATVTIGSALSVSVSASSSTFCSGLAVTLSASSAAPNFTWASGTTILGTTPTITVTPGTTTTYSVGALSGLCYGGNSITLVVLPTPTISVAITPSPLCVGVSSITFNASGASTYTYFTSTTTNPLTLAAPTADGSYFFNISGTAANGCSSAKVITFDVNPTPTVNATKSKLVVCVNEPIVLNASGAATYAWSGAATSTANPFTYTAPATAGSQQFTVTGTDTSGCTDTAVLSVSVSLCTGINGASLDSEISAFPNPFTGELTVSGFSGTIRIYNALGQLVVDAIINDNEKIETSRLPKGAYILKAYSKEGRLEKTIKLLKD